MAERVTIASEELAASIDPVGAELVSLRDAERRELMTDADPAFWPGHAPLLFPIVGALNGGRYRLDSAEYALPQHGFARHKPFALVDRAPDRATFRLTDDTETRAAYPFAFALEMTFALDSATLTMTATVTNTGDRAMPASFGYHPAFAWPLPYGRDRAAHRMVFEAAEGGVRPIVAGGLIGAGTRPSPLDGQTLALRDELFAVNALVWDAVNSRSLTYGAGDGPRLAIGWDAPMLGIWTKPGARFVCVEPWWGIADPDGFAGEIGDKPGMMRFAPGERRKFVISVTLSSPVIPA